MAALAQGAVSTVIFENEVRDMARLRSYMCTDRYGYRSGARPVNFYL